VASPTEHGPEVQLRVWLTAHLGAVTELTPLPGWRPAWNAIVEGPRGPLALHIRGERAAGLETQPLRREHDILKLLEREGIPVPHIHGWCDDPEAIIMDRIDDQPFHGGADTDPQVHALVGDYVAIMAEIHSLDIGLATDLGLTEPKTPRALALAYFDGNDRHYLAHKTKPDPLIEFVRKWLFANLPLHRREHALLIADAPQFFHDGTSVTKIFDLELAHIGDPMADLASLRVRDVNEPIGGIATLVDRYAVESGRAIDLPALDFHTIAAFLSVPMRVGSILSGSDPVPAYIEYLSWDLGCRRGAIEILASVLGIALDALPDAAPRRTPASPAFANLLSECAGLPAAEGRLREAPALSLARYLARLDAIGADITDANAIETDALLGVHSATPEAGEAALEEFVFHSGPEHHAGLIRLFHRRCIRQLQLLKGYPGPIVGRGPEILRGDTRYTRRPARGLQTPLRKTREG